MHTYQGKEKASSPSSAEAVQPGKKEFVTPDVTRIPAWAHTLPYPPLLAPDKSAVVQNNSFTQENVPSFSDSASRFGHDFSRIPVYSSHQPVLQPKLQVNQPGDVYEQEADQVAEQVMRMTNPETSASDEEDEEKVSLMRKQTNGLGAHTATDTSSVPPIVHDVLNSGGGQPLDATTQAFMEPRFGHDFSQVRVHTDAQAAESARAVNALAYTIGRDVVFGTGQYAPGRSEGRRLLAHELTHVLQQPQFALPSPHPIEISHPNFSSERDAVGITNRLEQTNRIARVSRNARLNVLYRQEQGQLVPQSQGKQGLPTFRIQEKPTVEAAELITDFGSPNEVYMTLGKFTMNAFVLVHAPTPTDFADWEVGPIQMASKPVDTYCYRRPTKPPAKGQSVAFPKYILVERMIPGPQYYPDRERDTPGPFTHPNEVIDLSQQHGGKTDLVIPVKTGDYPSYKHFIAASAYTHQLDDQDVTLFGVHHEGIFYTYIVARQKSTGKLLPLYVANWQMAAYHGYFYPGKPFVKWTPIRYLASFKLINHGLFRSTFPQPVVTGIPINEWVETHRSYYWTEYGCP